MVGDITLADYFRLNLARMGGPFKGRVLAEASEKRIVQKALDDIFVEADAADRIEYIFSGISLDHGVLKKTVRSGDVYCSTGDALGSIYILLGYNTDKQSYALVSITRPFEEGRRGNLIMKTENEILNIARLGYVY